MKLRPNITVKLVGYLLVAGLVPLLVLGLSSIDIARRVVIEQAQQANVAGLNRFAAYLRLYQGQIDDLAANIAGNETIGAALRDADERGSSATDGLNLRVQIGYILNSYVRTKGLVSLDLFSVSGEHFHVGETLDTSTVRRDFADSMLVEALSASTPTFWRGIGPNINTHSRHANVTSVARVLRHFSTQTGRNDTVGVLVISLSDEIMQEYLRDAPVGEGVRLMQIDRSGRVMLHSAGQMIGQPLSSGMLELVRAPGKARQFALDGEEVLMDVLPWRDEQGYLVSIIPQRLLTRGVDRIMFTLIGVVLIGIAGIVWLVTRFARYVVAPIRSVSMGFVSLQQSPDATHQPLPEPANDDEMGQLVHGYNNHLAALNARREAAEQLSRSEASRQATENVLLTAINAIDAAFVIYDADDYLIYWNDKVVELYPALADYLQVGLPYEQILRTAIAREQVLGLPIDHAEREAWIARHVARHHQSGITAEELTVQGRWIRIVERKTHQGQVVGFRVDITAVKLAQQAAEAANLAKSEFLANMSHEIRTPMNAMLGMMQFAREASSESERLMLIDKSLYSAQSLLTIVNDILDFSKIEAGKLAIDRVAFSPAQLIAEVCEIYRAATLDKGVSLTLTTAPNLPAAVWGDPQRVRQVLQNLLSNAVKFTVEGEIHVALAATTTGRLRWTIRDSGIGISSTTQARLFTSFSQADSSTTRRFGGTGLGLAICKRLVELMHGQIDVISESGAGATFWFELPLEEAPKSALAGNAKVDEGELLRALSGRHVLLVEDNRLNQEVALRFLSRVGITATVAEDGMQALECLARESVDAVLMDCQMPVMDGYEATRRIRAQARFATLPVIAMTANALVGDRERSLEAGMNDHLTKPLVAADFYRMLGRWLLGSSNFSNATLPTLSPEVIVEAADGPPAKQAARLDIAGALAQMANMRDLYNDVARMFPDDAKQQMRTLEAHLESGDLVTARRAAHSLKGISASAGAMQLRALAQAAEEQCKVGDIAAARAALPPLASELVAVIDALGTYLESSEATPS